MRYRAYGMVLDSSLELPELEPAATLDPDVETCTFATSARPPPERTEAIVYAHSAGSESAYACSRCDGGYIQTFGSVWQFFLSHDGRRVVAHEPLPPPETLRHILLDNVLPHALNLAGRDAIHATAVRSTRGVVAFTGPSGAGKSTLAARLVARGLDLVSDDCLLLSLEGGGVATTPSYAGLRLLPDAVAWMGDRLSASSLVTSDGTKRRIVGEHTAAIAGGPLLAIHALASVEATASGRSALGKVSKIDAFRLLLEASFRVDVDDRAMMKRQFDLFTAVTERVPIRRLVVPRSFAALDEACSSVLEDAGL